MDLYLIRHAPAEERAPGGDDRLRALTRPGRARAREAARGLRRVAGRIELVRHSPWTRALESAEIVARRFDCGLEVHAALARAPDEALLAALDGERLALVGHEPWLGELALWLSLGWRVRAGLERPAALALTKCGVAHLRGDPEPGAMRLVALYTGRDLARLGRR